MYIWGDYLKVKNRSAFWVQHLQRNSGEVLLKTSIATVK